MDSLFYKRLKNLLNNESWPQEYLFKFVLPNESKSLALVQKAFEDDNAQFQFRESKNGKYTSVSIKLVVLNANEVIQKYKSVQHIEKIISL